jgi:DNA-binding XRE family transcriptional regulator
LGLSKATVCGWETGQYDPDPRNAIRLCRLLKGLRFEAIYPLPEGQAA